MVRHRIRHRENPEDLSVWTSFTDLMSNAFMILTLFLLIIFVVSVLQRDESTLNINELLKQLANRETEIEQLKNAVQNLENEKQALEAQMQEASLGVPPIIVIPDNVAFRFPAGSATLSPALKQYIWGGLYTEIERNKTKYNIDTIEIIGHTDGQPNSNARSNLDNNLEQSVASNRLNQLSAGSNADLGLMRALAIVNELKVIQKQPGKLDGLQFRAYSAAQLYQLDGRLAPVNRRSDDTRRRIEVRFTKLGATEVQPVAR